MPSSFGELGIDGTQGIEIRWVSAPVLTPPIKTLRKHDRLPAAMSGMRGRIPGKNVLPRPPCPGRRSDGTSWGRHRGIVFPRRELLLEHHDERLIDGGLDLAIGSGSGAQKTQGNYCTICCTIPDTGG